MGLVLYCPLPSGGLFCVLLGFLVESIYCFGFVLCFLFCWTFLSISVGLCLLRSYPSRKCANDVSGLEGWILGMLEFRFVINSFSLICLIFLLLLRYDWVVSSDVAFVCWCCYNIFCVGLGQFCKVIWV